MGGLWQRLRSWTPDRAPMGAAKSKGASDTDGAEGVQAVGIRKSLIFGCRLLRIAGAVGLPIMVLDASNHCVDFGFWKATFGQHLGRQCGAPPRVIGSTSPMANVMQQRGGFNYLGVGTGYICNANREIANSERMRGVMPRRFAVKVPLYLQFEFPSPNPASQSQPTWENYTARRSIGNSKPGR